MGGGLRWLRRWLRGGGECEASTHLLQTAGPSTLRPMEIRDRILDAARRVYAQHGFRGATTRLIAIEAGVNEVSLFRTFGSKAALFQDLMRAVAEASPVPSLPDRPDDPERELTAWVGATLDKMREMRSILRKAIGEMEERPDAAATACEGPHCAGQILLDYVGRLAAAGLAEPEGDAETPVAMLMSTMWGDAMCRDMMSDAFPPADEAPARYVRAFLRAVGATPAAKSSAQRGPVLARGRRSAS